MAIWISWNIDIRRNLNSRDSFHRRNFENRAPTSWRPGAIVSLSTISFDVHAKVAEEIDLGMCSYEQLSEVQMLRDLDLDLGSSQGHANIHSICRTTRMPNCVTVASHITEIWPFHSSNIDIGQSLNSRDSFPRRKFKNRAPTSCSPGPILWPPTISFEFHAKTAEEIDLEKCTFRNFGSSVTFTLTLDRVEVILVCIRSRGLPTPN